MLHSVCAVYETKRTLIDSQSMLGSIRLRIHHCDLFENFQIIFLLLIPRRNQTRVQRLANDAKVGGKSSALFEVIKIVSLGSTSFVEEQHQTLYFLLTSTFALVTLSKSRSARDLWALLSCMALIRVGRTLNQTGDKWSHLPDLSDWLLVKENGPILVTLHLTSAFSVWLLSSLWRPAHFAGLFTALLSTMAAVCHHLATGSVELGVGPNYRGSEK